MSEPNTAHILAARLLKEASTQFQDNGCNDLPDDLFEGVDDGERIVDESEDDIESYWAKFFGMNFDVSYRPSIGMWVAKRYDSEDFEELEGNFQTSDEGKAWCQSVLMDEWDKFIEAS